MSREVFFDPCDERAEVFIKTVELFMQEKKVSRIRRTVGNALMIDFGKLTKFKIKAEILAKRKSKFGRKSISRGEWCFFVEMSDWAIYNRKKRILTSETELQKIDALIGCFKGRVLRKLGIARNGEVAVEFDKGLRIKVFEGPGKINHW